MTLLLLLIVAGQSFVLVLNSNSPAGERARAFIDALIARIRPKED